MGSVSMKRSAYVMRLGRMSQGGKRHATCPGHLFYRCVRRGTHTEVYLVYFVSRPNKPKNPNRPDKLDPRTAQQNATAQNLLLSLSRHHLDRNLGLAIHP